jgi:hypothetical protein
MIDAAFVINDNSPNFTVFFRSSGLSPISDCLSGFAAAVVVVPG